MAQSGKTLGGHDLAQGVRLSSLPATEFNYVKGKNGGSSVKAAWCWKARCAN